jgi:large subunit ribosomal protein L15
MKYNELQMTASKKTNRVGRGIAAGQGKTAGRGTKGQMSRTGSKKNPGFEGGQNPLLQRLPKLRGFTSHRTAPEVVYTGQLNSLVDKLVDAEVLAKNLLISSAYVSVKLISKGEITRKIDVKLNSASESAINSLNTTGGSFVKVAALVRPQTSTKKKLDKVAGK